MRPVVRPAHRCRAGRVGAAPRPPRRLAARPRPAARTARPASAPRPAPATRRRARGRWGLLPLPLVYQTSLPPVRRAGRLRELLPLGGLLLLTVVVFEGHVSRAARPACAAALC